MNEGATPCQARLIHPPRTMGPEKMTGWGWGGYTGEAGIKHSCQRENLVGPRRSPMNMSAPAPPASFLLPFPSLPFPFPSSIFTVKLLNVDSHDCRERAGPSRAPGAGAGRGLTPLHERGPFSGVLLCSPPARGALASVCLQFFLDAVTLRTHVPFGSAGVACTPAPERGWRWPSRMIQNRKLQNIIHRGVWPLPALPTLPLVVIFVAFQSSPFTVL